MKIIYINISVLLLFLLCFSMQLWATPQYKMVDSYTIDGIVYRIGFTKGDVENATHNNEVVVSGIICSKETRNITIPSTVYIPEPKHKTERTTYFSGTFTVAGINSVCCGNITDVDTLFIPSTVVLIRKDAFIGANIGSFQVDSANLFYTTKEGILYNKPVTTLAKLIRENKSFRSYYNNSSPNHVDESEDAVLLYDKSKTAFITYYSAKKNGLFRIPDGITHIADGAFARAEIDSLFIPSSVISIGIGAFQNSKLTSIVIPEGIKSIANNLFYGCSNLSSIIIPNGVTSIGNFAFKDCTNLTSIAIPNSVTSIGNFAFDGCTSLASIVIPESVVSIGERAFGGCISLASIVIPNGVTNIENHAFYGCKNLRSAYLPNVSTIQKNAFTNCILLDTIQIPDNVIIFPHAFHSTAWYNSQKEGMVFIGKVLYEYKEKTDDSGYNCCKMLQKTEITIPNGILGIVSHSFQNCKGLVRVNLPENLEYIGNYVFNGCTNLKSINIPKNVKTIYQNSFIGSGLRKINVYWQDPSSVEILEYDYTEKGEMIIKKEYKIHVREKCKIVVRKGTEKDVIDYGLGKAWFKSIREEVCVPEKCKLIVPKGTKEKYRQLDAWKYFQIVEREQKNK